MTAGSAADPALSAVPLLSVLVVVFAIGVVGVAQPRLDASGQPEASKGAERWPDPDQKQRAGAWSGYGGGQLAGECRVAECAERHRRRIDNGLRLIRVGTAGIAHERAGHLIDWSRGARGISSVQHESFDTELRLTAHQIDARRPGSGDPGKRAAADFADHIAGPIADDGDRIVDARGGDHTDDILPGHD